MSDTVTGPDERRWVSYEHNYCGGRIHLEAGDLEAGDATLHAVCSECGETYGLDLVEVVAMPVSEHDRQVAELREALERVVRDWDYCDCDGGSQCIRCHCRAALARSSSGGGR